MRLDKVRSSALVTALAVSALVGNGAEASSTLGRIDKPVVITGDDAGSLVGIASGDLVGFAWDGASWEQIPVQVDERHTMNLRDVYPRPFTCNPGTQCFNPGNRVLDRTVYSDPKTYAGADPDPTLDSEDEIVFMVKDTGAQAPDVTASPAGVVGDGVEIAVTDPIDSGAGYVYLFERDGNTLEPSAGQDYVDYVWDIDNIVDEANDYMNPQDHPTNPGYRFGGGYNPESSYVETAHYRRSFDDRWRDNGMQIFRGGASGVDILDRHDYSLTYDVPGACLRDQNTFAQGEGAFVSSIDGPVRAIRDYVGTNSGPLVQKQHIFYESHEEIRIDLRVHVIPGPQEMWDYNENATGLWYRNQFNPVGDRIDGIPSPYVTHPVILPDTTTWEAVDNLPTGPLPVVDPPAQGGVTYTVYWNTNNPDPIARLIYRDLGAGAINYCNGSGSGANSERAKLYGSHAAQSPGVTVDTDVTSTFLTTTRTLHYEAPGTTDGPKRLAEVTTALVIQTTER